jgi:uncharacterized protein YndB with AHSA1/START domain
VTDDVVLEAIYPYPADRVWRALTDPSEIATWLMPNDFRPVIGHRFTFRTEPRPSVGFDGIVHCEVTVVDPPHRLTYTWAGGGLATTVTWTLKTEAGGTRVRLEHRGFAGAVGQIASAAMRPGWQRILELGLRQATERIPTTAQEV